MGKSNKKGLRQRVTLPINELLILYISGPITPAANGENQTGTTPQIN